MDTNMEIRKLPPAAIFHLSSILDSGSAWKQVMAIVPSDPRNVDSTSKYTVEHIKLVENAGEKQNRSCTAVLLDEWGTSGKVRPNIRTLLDVLVKAELFRAAEYVAVELLQDLPPTRPATGPAAPVDVNPTGLKPADWAHAPQQINVYNPYIADIDYCKLQAITADFDDTPFKKSWSANKQLLHTGHKLGSGAFGTVYYGEMTNGRKVAVKKLGLDVVNRTVQFQNEIENLSKYQHPNLVCLLGFSCDTSQYCIVYEYMSNGALSDKLKLGRRVDKDVNQMLSGQPSSSYVTDKPLSWRQRLRIAEDTCRGINFLHTADQPLIHRDVKTANILLDDLLVAKLGDFGLVKVKTTDSDSKMVTSTIFGTSAYMAPEAFRGDVSVKMDVFSMGVVLLELLTGEPSYDENREDCDLVTYIEGAVDECIEPWLDSSAGQWDARVGEEVYQLALDCLKDKKKRPFAGDVLQKLSDLTDDVSTV